MCTIGIGTVEIPTRKSPDSVGEDSEANLRLTNVLHAPASWSNIIAGKPLVEAYEINLIIDDNPVTRGSITLDGEPIAYFNSNLPYLSIVLKIGLDLGAENRTIHNLSSEMTLFWSPRERERWNVLHTFHGHTLSGETKEVKPDDTQGVDRL
ncbi:hypothetical protein VTO42DRAFT_7637 [Malbranchea cinnamomea]